MSRAFAEDWLWKHEDWLRWPGVARFVVVMAQKHKMEYSPRMNALLKELLEKAEKEKSVTGEGGTGRTSLASPPGAGSLSLPPAPPSPKGRDWAKRASGDKD